MVNENSRFSNKEWFLSVIGKSNLLQVSDCFIDIGVGIEDSEAWLLAASGFDTGKIIGFEPHLERFEKLKDSYPGKLFNKAVSAQECILRGKSGGDFIAQTISTSEIETNSEFLYLDTQIDSVSVDSIVFGNNLNSACVWADVEGSEYEIVLGMLRSLMHGKIYEIFLELRQTLATVEIVKILSSFGYYPIGCSGVTDFKKMRSGVHVISHLYLKENEHADVAFSKVPGINPGEFEFHIVDPAEK